MIAPTDADEWIARTFVIQTRPRRVLLVTSDAGAAPPVEHTIDVRCATLQEAADAARGGDLVCVAPGAYAGFAMGDKPDAGDGRYVLFRAAGTPGSVVIDRPNPRDPRWMVLLQGAHHVWFEGFALAGAATPGDLNAHGPLAGVMLDGDFGRSGGLAHHLAIVGNYLHHHATWGLHATDTHTVLVQDNVFAFSAREHGAYVSDGSNHYVIRRNIFFGNHGSGLQCNLDPEASLREVIKHPAVSCAPYRPDRAWAESVLRAAEEHFGRRQFPDGTGEAFLIEENVINGNGRRGGAGLNLAALTRSTIQNNLVYGNHAHGIAQWDNDNPFDASTPELPPRWGCRENLIRNNTVLMSHPTRAALQCHHGSYGCRVFNNLLVNDQGPSIQIDRTSLRGFEARCNAFSRWTDGGAPAELRALARALPDEASNSHGLSLATLVPELAHPDAHDARWIVATPSWWSLNPGRPDFRPRRDSRHLAGRAAADELPARDLEGRARVSCDIGGLACR